MIKMMGNAFQIVLKITEALPHVHVSTESICLCFIEYCMTLIFNSLDCGGVNFLLSRLAIMNESMP